jgi:hypothetical protein
MSRVEFVTTTTGTVRTKGAIASYRLVYEREEALLELELRRQEDLWKVERFSYHSPALSEHWLEENPPEPPQEQAHERSAP